jgi:hypothetical protein
VATRQTADSLVERKLPERLRHRVIQISGEAHPETSSLADDPKNLLEGHAKGLHREQPPLSRRLEQARGPGPR